MQTVEGRKGPSVILNQQQWRETIRAAGDDIMTLGKRIRASVRIPQTSHFRPNFTLAS